MSGFAPKKRKTNVKTPGNAAAESKRNNNTQKPSKQKLNFAPVKTNERDDGNQTKALSNLRKCALLSVRKPIWTKRLRGRNVIRRLPLQIRKGVFLNRVAKGKLITFFSFDLQSAPSRVEQIGWLASSYQGKAITADLYQVPGYITTTLSYSAMYTIFENGNSPFCTNWAVGVLSDFEGGNRPCS